MTMSFTTKMSLLSFAILVCLGVVYLAITLELGSPARPSPPPVSSGGAVGSVLAGTPGPLPDLPQKPKSQEITFKGCPPEGDSSDPELNRLKNRVDEGAYIPIQFDAILNLPWPKTIERKDRAKWSPADTASVSRHEGIPVAVEGFLYEARLEGPESPNCHGADAEFRDHHIWLVSSASDERNRAIVVEMTPRVRANHPTWATDALNRIAKNKQRVRISGWLMLDPEHPDQVGKTRGTIWEIHPIMKVEVNQSGSWSPF